MGMLRTRVGAVTAALLACLWLPAAAAPDEEFSRWLAELKDEGLTRGLAANLLDEVTAKAELLPRVIELDRRQPEFTLSFSEYLDRVVPQSRVEKARARLAEHRNLLDRIAARYHVQPRFIVALWGIETDFGRVKGGFPVINALITLAHDGRRSAYFRGELFEALQVLQQGHIPLGEMSGSWAGAMGQVQFMPSSFNRYAVDGDGDGRNDIWNSRPDALASGANYLHQSGWQDDQTWGRQVLLPSGFDPALVGRDIIKPMHEWQALGVRRISGADLPGRNLDASVVQPGGVDGPAYLVYDNYRTLLKWNRSDYFATAVGLLSDRIIGR